MDARLRRVNKEIAGTHARTHAHTHTHAPTRPRGPGDPSHRIRIRI